MDSEPTVPTVSVVIPALNEEETVGAVVASVVPHLNSGLVSEIIVVDSDSTDATAERARAAGARVVNWREPVALAPRPGKGEALWRGVAASSGEIIVFMDADVSNPDLDFVPRLVEKTLADGAVIVKADYARPGRPGTGGRVTELTAKPLLALYFPELAALNQPLAGEYALRREFAVTTPFPSDYGVEIALLIDCAQRFGAEAISEVHLGSRSHRNRPLHELRPMADQVARALLVRAGVLATDEEGERPPLATLGIQ